MGTTNFDVVRANQFIGPVTGGGDSGSGLPTTTGTYFYVDSSTGSDGDDGLTPANALATIDAAINKCTANKNDVIVVMPNHAETITAAAGIAADVAGIAIVGIGVGEVRPTITFATNTVASMTISGSDVLVRNLVFKCNIASQSHMLDLTGDDTWIDNCYFTEGSATGLSFITADGTDADCDRLKITNCRFYAPTAGNYDNAISLAKDFVGVRIQNNDIYGDFDDGGISIPAGGNACLDLVISNNRIVNLQAGQYAILINGTSCTGQISDCYVGTNALATAVDNGSLRTYNVRWADTTDQVSSAMLFPEVDSTSNMIGSDDSDNAFASTNVTANDDGSVLERLEALATERLGSAPSFNHPNYFVVTADMTSATWNTQAQHEIATVTGMVRMCIIPQVTATLTDAADGASIQLGIEGSTSAIIGSTGAAGAGGNTLSTNEFWVDTSPADVICTEANLGALTFTVGGGLDVGYEITGAALTGGTILFHIWWIKQDSTGAVTAGTGATL